MIRYDLWNPNGVIITDRMIRLQEIDRSRRREELRESKEDDMRRREHAALERKFWRLIDEDIKAKIKEQYGDLRLFDFGTRAHETALARAG